MLNRKQAAYTFLIIAVLNAILYLYENSTNVWSCISAGCLLILAVINVINESRNEKQ
jgi:membrane protein YdbS with pleckstrin-like domain